MDFLKKKEIKSLRNYNILSQLSIIYHFTFFITPKISLFKISPPQLFFFVLSKFSVILWANKRSGCIKRIYKLRLNCKVVNNTEFIENLLTKYL